ncbi:growth/differentiation factor 6-A-like [Liolophura sinensis]|uniref:growth/differentiation factor 6-A-like n=1 Tax=Liolophura sinensis TaxID=3198878 RepID=UPI003158C880
MSVGRLLVMCSVFLSCMCRGERKEEEKASNLFPGHDVASSRMKSLLESSGILSEGLRLADLQKTAENSSEDTQPHDYILSVWAAMMAGEENNREPQKEPSVVAVLSEPPTDDVHVLKEMTLMFSLNKSLSQGVESVTAAEIILYKNSKLSARDSDSDTVTVKLTVYNANDNQFNSTYTRELTNQSNTILLFNVTKVFKKLVEEMSSEMKVIISLNTSVTENLATSSVGDYLVTEDPTHVPLLIVYHNMVPLDPEDRLTSVGQKIDDEGDYLSSENTSGSRQRLNVGFDAHNSSDHRMRRKARRYRAQSSVIHNHNPNCHLHSWVVDFHADLRWTWIKFPTSVRLNFCGGICPSPLAGKELNSTNNAFIRDQYIVATKWQHREIPATSCVPIKLAPIDVYYVAANNDHVIRRLPDVVSEDCACL